MLSRTATRATPARQVVRHLSRRGLGTTPPAQKPRSFKSSLARWAIAGAGVYYVGTHDIFSQTGLPRPPLESPSETHDTIDALIAARRERKDAAARGALLADAPAASPSASPISPQDAPAPPEAPGDPAALEEEAEHEGAFNPETGEINWDCSCLGGMAHGPCGPEFREAFSCFVYSTDEPKGIECVPKFKNMQDCFRAHPDVYGAELTDDPTDEELAEGAAAAEAEAASRQPSPASPPSAAAADAPYSGEIRNPNIPDRGMTATPASSPRRVGGATGYETKGPGSEERKDKAGDAPSNERSTSIDRSRAARAQVASDHGADNSAGELVPKVAHDAQAANVGK